MLNDCKFDLGLALPRPQHRFPTARQGQPKLLVVFPIAFLALSLHRPASSWKKSSIGNDPDNPWHSARLKSRLTGVE